MDNNVKVKYIPSAKSFKTAQSASLKDLVSLSYDEIRPILPSLVRTSMCTPLDTSTSFLSYQREIQKKIASFDAVNSIVAMLSIDFHMVHEDALKEQHLQKKLGLSKFDNDLLPQPKGLLLEFEESDALKRMRLVLSEVMRLVVLCEEQDSFSIDDTELFGSQVYLEEISDILCIAFSEIPSLLETASVAEGLLRVKFGPVILCRVIVNNPNYFGIVCSSILSHMSSADELNIETQLRMNTLKLLCSMNPQYCKTLRAECVSLSKLAGLAIRLSIPSSNQDYSCDIVPFFTSILLASDSKTKAWIVEYIKTAQKEPSNSSLSLFRNELVVEMKKVIETFNRNHQSEAAMDVDGSENLINSHVMHGIAIMRLYCALKSTTGFKLSHEESEVLLDMMTCETTVSPVGVRYVVVSICTLVACAFLLHSQEREDKVTQWFRRLVDKSSKFEKEVQITTSYGETLLLIAIHFHGHSLEPIVELVSSNLGIKMKFSSLTKIKILFTQQVFPEKVVAEHALTVPVTKHLNRSMKWFLPAHCILQLMKSRVFTKNTIPVKDWLFRQICSCSAPVHPLMLSLIETYVTSVINPINISKTKTQRLNSLQPFDEKDIIDIFENKTKSCCDVKTTKLLLFCYSLMYQNALLANMKTLINNLKAPREYTPQLYACIPMKQLLLEARANEQSYSDLYPPLLRLLSTHYPHLCLVEDWIVEEELASSIQVYSSDTDRNQDVDEISAQDEQVLLSFHECTQKTLLKLQKLIRYPPDKLIPYMRIVLVMLKKLLQPNISKKLHILVVKVWMKLNTVVPRRFCRKKCEGTSQGVDVKNQSFCDCSYFFRLWLDTVNTLRQQPANAKHEWEMTPEYTDEEIQKDPLIVLRCDSRIFRSPLLFDVIIRVLNGYSTASRALLSHHLLANPIASTSKPMQEILSAEQEREELKSALVLSQESAAIQILLEVCLPTQDEKQNSSYAMKSTLREIHCKVCCFLHQSFISNPNMARLIHFQTYPPDLLDVIVAGVPSMHICIDFIPELMNQPHLEKQLFAVQLISHLALQYPIPKSFSMCKYILQRLNDLLVALPVAKRNQYFVPASDALERISKAFPPLREDIVKMLVQIGKTAKSQWNKASLTVTSQICLADTHNDDNDDDDHGIDEGENYEKKLTMGNNEGEQSNKLEKYNPAYSRTFLKVHSSEELFHATEKAFQLITNLTLKDKLVFLDT